MILGLGVILAALAMLLMMKLIDNTSGNQIRITVDGAEYGTYSLDRDQEIEVQVGEFYNKICIHDGEAYMEEANCPDGYCMNQGKIKGNRQTIICLPHKLVVEVIVSDTENQSEDPDMVPDTVAK